MKPSKEAIKQTRLKAGFTQTAAAELIGYKLRTWQMWESGDRSMRPKLFEYFKTLIKGETK